MWFHPVVCLFLLSSLVLAESLTNGNLSRTFDATPRTLSTSAKSTPRVAEYILAAFGQTATSRTTSSNATVAVSNTDVGSKSSESSTLDDKPSTVCNYGRCYTDVSYTAEPIETAGTGSAYATKCLNVQNSYSKASSAWAAVHEELDTQTQIYGGRTTTTVVYYSDASTLCDGWPRVTYSPAIPKSTRTVVTTLSPASTTTYIASLGYAFPASSPVCTINPGDCDNLYKTYSSDSLIWAASASASSQGSLITPSPMLPPCVNSSQSSIISLENSLVHGCGPCTIFGQDVQLVYFPVPTTVSRDMCASAPSASLTYYDKDVVEIITGPGSAITDVNGPIPETAVYRGQTFTSGTAYISIGTVWAGDRCSSTLGSTVSDVILAMPSESVLSLRYSQDHFQYFELASSQTGYPFNYADMNKPIPYSAWNGQQMCSGPSYPDSCTVIYEDQFNPQLAMPPGIRKLRPEFETCQMWYGGLYDPPFALQPASALAIPTAVAGAATTPASQASSVTPTTPMATALAQSTDAPTALADSTEAPTASIQSTKAPTASTQDANNEQDTEPTVRPVTNPITTIAGLAVGQDPSDPDAITFAGYTLKPGDPDTIIGGTRISAMTSGIVIDGSTLLYSPTAAPLAGHIEQSQTALDVSGVAATAHDPPQAHSSASVTFAADGQTHSAILVGNKVIYGSQTLSVGGSAATDGEHKISAVANGVVFDGVTATPVTAVQSSPATGAIITAAGSTYAVYAGSSSAVEIDSTTLTPGGAAATLPNGQVVSAAGKGAIVVQGSTVALSAIPAAATTTTAARGTVSSTSSGATSDAEAVTTSFMSLTHPTRLTQHLSSSTKSGAGPAASRHHLTEVLAIFSFLSSVFMLL
ncbi:hypothetical protein MBLNU459_g1586t1 [Dothideomycetes sp. NU459]